MLYHFECYLFLKEFNLEVQKKIIKNKIKNIIYYNFNNLNYTYINKIRQWCKSQKIKFFVINDHKLATQINSDGIYLTSNYKKINYFSFRKKNFTIIGSAHNQIEYYYKRFQNCQKIFLSPIFKTKKYSNNQILGLAKFNLMSLNWDIQTVALGGIRKKNISLINLTKNKSAAFQSFIEEI
jgi:thiamine-phosphate pyrophosphorylase